jgi:uncharacterized protein YdcH (DUF465 family)
MAKKKIKPPQQIKPPQKLKPPQNVKPPQFFKKIFTTAKNIFTKPKSVFTNAVCDKTQLNNCKNDLNLVKTQYNNSIIRIQNINTKFDDLNREKKNIEGQLKIKNEQYNKLLNDYNVQLKDKQGVMDYLTINEHFSTIEGLTPAEIDAVVKLTGNLDKNFYNSIVNQNNQLDTEIQQYKNNYSTDDQKVFYQSQQVDYLNIFNSYLFIIYYAFLIIFCYFLYYSNTMSKYMKIGILLLLILYPFSIMMIEKNIYNTIMYIFSFINGIAYANNYLVA